MVGTMGLCSFGGIVILNLNDKYCVSAFDFGDGQKSKRRTKVHYSNKGVYINRYRTKYYLKDFLRVD